MKEIFGKHRQDLSEVRRLCLLCHGLELTSDKLFNGSTYLNKGSKTKSIFQNLFSNHLLSLAAAIRVNLYQNEFKASAIKLSHCGFYYEDPERVHKEFSVKDVSDKIIHATSISKAAFPRNFLRDSKMLIQFKGEHHDHPWTLDLSVELFTEAILNHLDELEGVEA